ncbi:MAG: universal stress protein [Chloroflexi bacterium]|nr:universal stress protein [Chloroflexota bacterium]
MLEKILVCLDGSVPAEQMLSYLLDEAKRANSKVILLRVTKLPQAAVSVNVPGSPGAPVHTGRTIQRVQDEEAEANRYLKEIADSLLRSGLHVEYAVIPGSPGETIVNYASKNGCTVIAVATHGHGGLRRFALGSTTDFVTRHSVIPVLTIRPGSAPSAAPE